MNKHFNEHTDEQFLNCTIARGHIDSLTDMLVSTPLIDQIQALQLSEQIANLIITLLFVLDLFESVPFSLTQSVAQAKQFYAD